MVSVRWEQLYWSWPRVLQASNLTFKPIQKAKTPKMLITLAKIRILLLWTQAAFLPLSLLLWGATWIVLLWKSDLLKPSGAQHVHSPRQTRLCSPAWKGFQNITSYGQHGQISPGRTAAASAPACHPCLSAPKSLVQRGSLKWVPRWWKVDGLIRWSAVNPNPLKRLEQG